MASQAAKKLTQSPPWRGARRAGWGKMATKSRLLNPEKDCFISKLTHPYPSQEGTSRLFSQELFSVELTLIFDPIAVLVLMGSRVLRHKVDDFARHVHVGGFFDAL